MGGSNIFTPLQEERPRFEYLRAEIPKLELCAELDNASQRMLDSFRKIVDADDQIVKARKEYLKARDSCRFAAARAMQ